MGRDRASVLPVRRPLIARRVDPEKAAARVRQQERTAKRKGWQVRDITRSLCVWAVLVTNVLVPWLTATEARIL